MKKVIQIFVVLVLLTSFYTAQARSSKGAKSSAVVKANMASKALGGEMVLTVVVFDSNNRPIQGATVSAPCTGLANKLTDVHGVATFDMGTVCTCSENACTVTTSHGCSQQIKVSCNTYQVTCTQ